jgi:hypothetical protein
MLSRMSAAPSAQHPAPCAQQTSVLYRELQKKIEVYIVCASMYLQVFPSPFIA